MKNCRLIATVFFSLLLYSGLKGQSHRYWAHNYGEDAFLLSGAVVAGSSGTGAIYYNPGAISRSTNARLSLNSGIITAEQYRLDKVLGQEINARVTNFKVLPSFISVIFKDKKNSRLTYEAALLSHEEIRIEFNEGVNGRTEVFPALEGEELYDARMELKMDYSDYWAGFGAGYVINDHFYAGLSSFVIARSGSNKFLLDINAFPASDSAVMGGQPIPFFLYNYQERESFRYNQFRMLWKAGLLYTADQLSVGLSITAPSFPIPILSSSNAAKKISATNAINAEGNALGDFIIVDQQAKRPVNFKDPFSISLGLRLRNADQTAGYFATVEYYAGLSTYTTFDADLNPNITIEEIFSELPNPYFLRRYTGAKPVLNAAVGYRRNLPSGTSLMAGFRTDFNYLKDYDFSDVRPLTEPKNVNMDVYHFTAGSTFNIRSSYIILGFQFSFGSQDNLPRLADIDYPTIVNPPGTELPKDMKARYRSLSMFFGFNLNLGKNANGNPPQSSNRTS